MGRLASGTSVIFHVEVSGEAYRRGGRFLDEKVSLPKILAIGPKL